MTDDTRQLLQQILDYCNKKWAEADQASAGAWPTPEMLIGQKKAYNEVVQFVRSLLDAK